MTLVSTVDVSDGDGDRGVSDRSGRFGVCAKSG